MARPRTIPDQQMLHAARAVFLEQGFSATTASIAKRAGVSEGTLFKRFATKEDLFAAALGLSEYGTWRGELLKRVGQDDVQRNLEWAALHVLTEAERLLPNLLAVFSRGFDPQHNPALPDTGHPTRQDTHALTEYLRAEAALGRVRPQDADTAALTLMGALIHYVHQEHILPCRSSAAPPENSRFVRGLIDLLWPGLAPTLP